MNRPQLVIALALLSACTNDEVAGGKYAERAKTSDHLNAELNAMNDVGAPATIKPTSRIYLGDNRILVAHGDPLPARVEGPRGFVLSAPSNGVSLSLQALAGKIAKATGLAIVVEDSARVEDTILPPPAISKSDDAVRSINSLIVGAKDGAPRQLTANFASFAGPLSDFLEESAAKFGTDWDVHDHVIYLGRDIIRSYEVVDFPSSTTLSAGLTGSSSTATSTQGAASPSLGGGANGSAIGSPASGGQNSVTTTNLNSWKELLASLSAYTGARSPEDAGKAIFPEPSNGRVTVKCSRYCQGLVARTIRDHNEEAGRSVLVTVAILNVQKNGSDDYGFSPSILYNNLPTGYSLSTLGQTSAVTAAQGGTITGAVVNPPSGSIAAKFNGTSIAVQAISQVSEITGGFQKYALIGNNRAFSIRNALDYGYVQSQTTQLNANISSTGLNVATQVIGDQLQILPRIQHNSYIRMQIAVSRTAIQSTSTVSLNGTATTIPQITDNSYSPQEFTLRDGATLILTDISDDSSSRVRSGAGSLWNWLLGGSAIASNTGDKTIIIVTAREWHAADEGSEYLRDALK